MTVIANTTVLSNFASIGELDFLHRLYRTLYISTHVYEEIQAGLNEGYRFYEGIEKLIYPLSEKGWIRLIGLDTSEEIRLFAEMPKQLHSGEASCLAIAGVRQWLFLSDDATARRIGIRRGVAVSGTIGSLVLGVERGECSLTTANGWLMQLITIGYRSPLADLSSLVRKV